MHDLKRKVRFSEPSPGAGQLAHNGYGGSPCFHGISFFDELEITYRGQIQAETGYLIDIKTIDRAVRSVAAPLIWNARKTTTASEPGELLRAITDSLNRALSNGVAIVRWNLTPYYSVEMNVDRPHTVVVRQKFDFAAAHRLHTSTLSDEENRRIFGKCNNPSGHGHNYQVEPAVEVELDSAGHQPLNLLDLEAVTDRVIIEPFDHKHLNTDTREFGPGGVNPTVENIAKVFFELLAPEVRRTCPGARLCSLTVWETDRTSCTYSDRG